MKYMLLSLFLLLVPFTAAECLSSDGTSLATLIPKSDSRFTGLRALGLGWDERSRELRNEVYNYDVLDLVPNEEDVRKCTFRGSEQVTKNEDGFTVDFGLSAKDLFEVNTFFGLNETNAVTIFTGYYSCAFMRRSATVGINRNDATVGEDLLRRANANLLNSPKSVYTRYGTQYISEIHYGAVYTVEIRFQSTDEKLLKEWASGLDFDVPVAATAGVNFSAEFEIRNRDDFKRTDSSITIRQTSRGFRLEESETPSEGAFVEFLNNPQGAIDRIAVNLKKFDATGANLDGQFGMTLPEADVSKLVLNSDLTPISFALASFGSIAELPINDLVGDQCETLKMNLEAARDYRVQLNDLRDQLAIASRDLLDSYGIDRGSDQGVHYSFALQMIDDDITEILHHLDDYEIQSPTYIIGTEIEGHSCGLGEGTLSEIKLRVRDVVGASDERTVAEVFKGTSCAFEGVVVDAGLTPLVTLFDQAGCPEDGSPAPRRERSQIARKLLDLRIESRRNRNLIIIGGKILMITDGVERRVRGIRFDELRNIIGLGWIRTNIRDEIVAVDNTCTLIREHDFIESNLGAGQVKGFTCVSTSGCLQNQRVDTRSIRRQLASGRLNVELIETSANHLFRPREVVWIPRPVTSVPPRQPVDVREIPCTVNSPCKEGQGTCYLDVECDAGLMCHPGTSSHPDYVYENEALSFCVPFKRIRASNRNACSFEALCDDGEGSCSSNADCQGSLQCRDAQHNAGYDLGNDRFQKICVRPQTPFDPMDCECCGATSSVCDHLILQEGDGHCWHDGHCAEGLSCVPNSCGLFRGFTDRNEFSESDSCCMELRGTEKKSAGTSFELIKTGHECESSSSYLGRFSTVEDCANRAGETGSQFFIYGIDSKAGKCYTESTQSASCPEGWERDAYNFYEIRSALADIALVAYWDKGSCGPLGDDANWHVCGWTSGDCPEQIETSRCTSGRAIKYRERAQVTIDGCDYHYYTEYACLGLTDQHGFDEIRRLDFSQSDFNTRSNLCAGECAKEPRCHYWVAATDSHACWLLANPGKVFALARSNFVRNRVSYPKVAYGETPYGCPRGFVRTLGDDFEFWLYYGQLKCKREPADRVCGRGMRYERKALQGEFDISSVERDISVCRKKCANCGAYRYNTDTSECAIHRGLEITLSDRNSQVDEIVCVYSQSRVIDVATNICLSPESLTTSFSTRTSGRILSAVLTHKSGEMQCLERIVKECPSGPGQWTGVFGNPRHCDCCLHGSSCNRCPNGFHHSGFRQSCSGRGENRCNSRGEIHEERSAKWACDATERAQVVLETDTHTIHFDDFKTQANQWTLTSGPQDHGFVSQTINVRYKEPTNGNLDFTGGELCFDVKLVIDTPDVSFELIKSGHECQSSSSYLGKFSTVEDCANRAGETGSRFFIYGTDSKAGNCYSESTRSASCPEGWERDSYNFYEIRSGLAACSYQHLGGLAADEGTLLATGSGSLEDAKAACDASGSCHSFGYCGHEQEYYQFDKVFTGGESVSHRTDCVTYYDPCAEECSIQRDTDYFGDDIHFIDNIMSAEICASACAQYDGCDSWTWGKKRGQWLTNRCFLKTGTPSPSTSDCCDSGMKNACQIPSDYEPVQGGEVVCSWEGTTNGQAHSAGGGSASCGRMCNSRADCNSFTICGDTCFFTADAYTNDPEEWQVCRDDRSRAEQCRSYRNTNFILKEEIMAESAVNMIADLNMDIRLLLPIAFIATTCVYVMILRKSDYKTIPDPEHIEL